jgi:predicted nucleic acid-binding Zn ribbon protein
MHARARTYTQTHTPRVPGAQRAWKGRKAWAKPNKPSKIELDRLKKKRRDDLLSRRADLFVQVFSHWARWRQAGASCLEN